jgi:hypothetical protein
MAPEMNKYERLDDFRPKRVPPPTFRDEELMAEQIRELLRVEQFRL